MGQKVNPISLRLGINQAWPSVWHNESNYAYYLHKDLKIRNFLQDHFKSSSILLGDIQIKWEYEVIDITLNVHDEKNKLDSINLDALLKVLEEYSNSTVKLSIFNHNHIHNKAAFVAHFLGNQLEKRISFALIKRKTTELIDRAMEGPVLGVKVQFSGRINGVEMAKTEVIQKGRVPLHTLKAPIDYAFINAYTVYGSFGVKVWYHYDTVENKTNNSGILININKKNIK